MIKKFWLLKIVSPTQYHSLTVKHGIDSYTDLMVHLWEMLTFDLKHGVSTRKIVQIEDLDFTDHESHKHAQRYRGSPVICVRKSLRYLKKEDVDFHKTTFVDYGSGLGKVLIIAMKEGFLNLIGIELSSSLNEKCRKNMDKVLCSDCTVSIIEEDARKVPPPPEASVFFFYRPFGPVIFDGVMEQILQSVEMNPRVIYCLTMQAEYDFSKHNMDLITTEYGVRIYSNKGTSDSQPE